MRSLNSRSLASHGFVCAVCCICLIAGCADRGPQRFRLQGTVEFDGKPVPTGSIYFDPDTAKGNKGPQGFAMIVDGKFDTELGGKGHVGGPMLVRIIGHASAPSTTNVDEPAIPLFPEFQESIELERTEDSRGFIVPKDYAGVPEVPADAGP